MIHRGTALHAALPILSGERTNFVLWLFGDSGQLPPQMSKTLDLEPRQRWVKENPQQDEFAPF